MHLQPNQDSTLLTFKEAMRFLRVSRSTIYRLMWSGLLAGHKVGSTWRFYPEDLRACVTRNTDTPIDADTVEVPSEQVSDSLQRNELFTLLDEVNAVNREIVLRGNVFVESDLLNGYVTMAFYEPTTKCLNVKLSTYGTHLLAVDSAQWQSILSAVSTQATRDKYTVALTSEYCDDAHHNEAPRRSCPLADR